MTDQTYDASNAMRLIQALDPDAHLRFSEYTDGWYVSARIEVSDGAILRSVTSHQQSPDEAVWAFLRELQQVDINDFGHRLVTHAYGSERKEWRWNGAAFVLATSLAEVFS